MKNHQPWWVVEQVLPEKTGRPSRLADSPRHLHYFCYLHSILATVHGMEHKNKGPAKIKKKSSWLSNWKDKSQHSQSGHP